MLIKLVFKQFDVLVVCVCFVLEGVCVQECVIMQFCVCDVCMLCVDFLCLFLNYEIDEKWVDSVLKSKLKYVEVIECLCDDILCNQQKLVVLESEVELIVVEIKEINCVMLIGEVKVCWVKKEMVEVNLCLVIFIVKKYINCGL